MSNFYVYKIKMKNTEPNKQISFIEFLWREFNAGGFIIGNQGQSFKIINSHQSQPADSSTEFKWSSATRSRGLTKVLNIKLSEDTADLVDSEQYDNEEQQINNWQQTIMDNRRKND